jgi:hypothetical protein
MTLGASPTGHARTARSNPRFTIGQIMDEPPRDVRHVGHPVACHLVTRAYDAEK